MVGMNEVVEEEQHYCYLLSSNEEVYSWISISIVAWVIRVTVIPRTKVVVVEVMMTMMIAVYGNETCEESLYCFVRIVSFCWPRIFLAARPARHMQHRLDNQFLPTKTEEEKLY